MNWASKSPLFIYMTQDNSDHIASGIWDGEERTGIFSVRARDF
jgi:hypothetical protein